MENNKNKDPKIFWKLTKKLEQMSTCNTMAFSTTGLVNTHVIFVFRHGKHLVY